MSERSQFRLLAERRFGPFFCVQFLGAMNDNVFKQALVILLAYQTAYMKAHHASAFMAANLLAHSDLFRAGIARSGAYNRTLTPFGFQNEDRSYWDAAEVYQRMSPIPASTRCIAASEQRTSLVIRACSAAPSDRSSCSVKASPER